MRGNPSVRFPLFFWLAYWIAGCFSMFIHGPHPYFFFITFACFAVSAMWALLAMDTQYELNTKWMSDEEYDKLRMTIKNNGDEEKKKN